MLSYSLRDNDPSAPLVLYLHGLGIAGWCWQPVAATLPEYGALAPDFPGHGGSADIAWQSISQTARHVSEVIDTLPAQRELHLTGHSLGAYVGLTLLCQRPERFKSALLSSFHIGESGYANLLKFAYVLNGAMFKVPFLLRRFANIFGDAQAAEKFIEGAKAIKSQTIRRAGIEVVDFKAPDRIGALDMPILAVAGSREPESIRSMPAWFEEQNSPARGQVLEGRDHLWPIKEPQLYAQLLKDHMASCE